MVTAFAFVKAMPKATIAQSDMDRKPTSVRCTGEATLLAWGRATHSQGGKGDAKVDRVTKRFSRA
jgi:hypothetical protein